MYDCNCLQTAFSELVLPYVIHDILEAGTESHQRILSKQMRLFISEHCNTFANTGQFSSAEI